MSSNTGVQDAAGAAVSVERMRVRKHGANIRMYRQGLGDAFLLAFDRGQGDEEDPIYVLIDCGVILGTPTPRAPLTAVVEGIKAATGGHIHLLIITHEHWDHVGSFQQVFDLWKCITIDAVWMAWTEDPLDPLGIQLKQQFKNDLDALCMAVAHQQKSDATYQKAVAALAAGADPSELPTSPLAALVGLFGVPEDILHFGHGGEQLPASVSFGINTHVGMKNARSLAGPNGKNVSFLKPGVCLDLPGTDAGAVRVYVLGPPRDPDLLKDINPSTRDPQTYSKMVVAAVTDMFGTPPLAPTEKAAFTLAVRRAARDGGQGASASPLSPEEEEVADFCLPFEGHQGQNVNFVKGIIGTNGAPAADPEFVQFLHDYYGVGGGASGEDAPDWRRIDTDWLGVAGELALQMDSYTNNTSLALAFELKDGTVLLFPADAQVGNWVSWDLITPPFDPGDGRTVHAADLLARTQFYKVGHHGSHNATMRAIGLERMTDPKLIAFVPVDEEIAHTKKNWNEMPFDPLMARLYEKTGGRVVRADLGVVTGNKPRFLPDELWGRIQDGAVAFSNKAVVRPGPHEPRVRPDSQGNMPLYYEVSVPQASSTT